MWSHRCLCFELLIMSTMGFKARRSPNVCFVPMCKGFLRFTLGATPADLLQASMVAELYRSTCLNFRETLIFSRYLELVHPIWHKTHFKVRWIYISFAFNWILGITLCLHLVATSKVNSFKQDGFCPFH